MYLQKPPARVLRTPRDAEEAARDWMKYFGHTGVRLTLVGPDFGIDVESDQAYAQVKSGNSRTGRPVVQQIYGAAALDDKSAYLFTVAGVTDEARDWAAEAGVALFRLDLSGDLAAENEAAQAVLSQAAAQSEAWSPVRQELERLIRENRTAVISSEIPTPDGRRAYWAIWHMGDGEVQVVKDLFDATGTPTAGVSGAVAHIAGALAALGLGFADCEPHLTVDGRRRPLTPSASRPARSSPERDARPVPSPRPTSSSLPQDATVRITASDVYAAYAGPQCERRVYLEAHGITGAEPSALHELLISLGREHERSYLNSLSDVTDLSSGSIDDRATETLDALQAGATVLYQPVFIIETRLGGLDCSVIGVPDFLIKQRDGYAIRDTKTARNVGEDERPDIANQLQVYGLLLEVTTGRTPTSLEILAGDGELHTIDYHGKEHAYAILSHIASLKTAASEPYCPVKWSNRTSCPHFTRCWTEAVGNDDVVTLPGLTRNTARQLRSSGIATISDLLQRHSPATLAEVRAPHGSRMRRVGRRAERILASARSLATGAPVFHRRLRLPTTDHVVLFDLEGMPPLGGRPAHIYLWGTAVRGPDPLEYSAEFASPTAIGDRDGWLRFLDRCALIFRTYGDDVPFLHWASYEKTQVSEYLERYGDRDGIGSGVLRNLTDLLRETREAVTLPVHSYSLKALEQYVGFERSQTEYGGDWSIALWDEALHAGSEEDKRRLLAELATYNREDLDGMWAVYQYLRRLSSTR